MFRQLILLCITAALGLQTAPAEDTASPAPTPPEKHPFLHRAMYPAWSQMTEQQFITDAEEAMDRAQEGIQALLQLNPKSADFDETFGAVDRIICELNRPEDYFFHLQRAGAAKPGLAAGFNLVKYRLYKARKELNENPAIHQILKEWAETHKNTALSPEKRHILQALLKQTAPETDAKKSKLLNQKHSRLYESIEQYLKNRTAVVDSWQYVFTEQKQLAGVPQGTLRSMEEAARRAGFATPEKPAWLISLQEPSVLQDIMDNCTVESTRKKCWQGIKSPGFTRSHDNAPVLHSIMRLRHEIALLQGYANHADKKLSTYMLQNSKKALAFVDDMLLRLKPAADAANTALLDSIAAQCGSRVNAVQPWNYSYYVTHSANNLNRFNPAVLRPYFEYETILNGTIDYFARLYGLRIQELPTTYRQGPEPCPEGHIEVWAPGVRLFAVYDADTGNHLGSFYLDAFARTGKTYGSSSQIIRIGTTGKHSSPQLAAMMLQLHTPAAGNTLLLSHLELRMLFHEFGHVLHLVLGKGELPTQSACWQSLDFIELPALLHEAHAWEPDMLCSIARHYATGEPLPRDLAEKLAATRYGTKHITATIGSLILAKTDLELHSHYHEKFYNQSLDSVCEKIAAPWRVPSTGPFISLFRNLPHCVQGYDACLYAYVLAEVMAEDVLSHLKQQGLRNSAFGRAFRKTILEPGNSLPPQHLYRNLMGRDVCPNAFLKKLLHSTDF